MTSKLVKKSKLETMCKKTACFFYFSSRNHNFAKKTNDYEKISCVFKFHYTDRVFE